MDLKESNINTDTQDENLDSPMEFMTKPPVNPEVQRKFEEYFKARKSNFNFRAFQNTPRPMGENPSTPPGPVGYQIDEGFRKTLERKSDVLGYPPALPYPPPPEWMKIVVMLGGAGFGLLCALVVKFGISGLYDYLFKSETKIETPDLDVPE